MKNKRLIFLIALALFFLVGVAIFYFSAPKDNRFPPPSSALLQQKWNSVTPGKTTKEELLRGSGEPIKTEGDKLLYASNNQYWPTQIKVETDMVTFIKEPVFAPAEESFKKRSAGLSERPTILYGPESSSGHFLYVYPGAGVAFLANKTTDRVFEAWYFPQTTIGEFLQLPEALGYGVTEKSGGF